MLPKESDFKFDAPAGWGQNLMAAPAIQSISSGESAEKAKLMIDDQPATTWASTKYKLAPVITLDLQENASFNRIVIFNRYTDMRGTAGGL